MGETMTDKLHPPEKDCSFVLPKEAGHHSCPAGVWIWLIHSFLQRTRNIKPKNLEAEYSKVLQQELGREGFFPGVEVYWAPAKEKASVIELHHATSRHDDNVCPRDFQGAFSSILIELNRSFHSQYALRKISDAQQQKGGYPAFVYQVKAEHDAIRLTFLNQDNMQTGNSGKVRDFTLSFRRVGIPEPHFFYTTLQKKYDHSLTEEHLDDLQSAVKKYVETWNDDALIEPEKAFLDKAELLEAAKHFVLMALYMAANEKGGASYFLAPSIYPRHDSTMVIYWPREIPDRNLHFLLQFILKLNAFPLIMAESFRENVLAQQHNINNMNPLSYMEDAMEMFAQPELSERDRVLGLQALKEAHKKLQLMTVAVNVAFEGDLENTSLGGLTTFKDILAFFVQVRGQNIYTDVKQAEPIIKYLNGSETAAFQIGMKKAMFNCLWNLWHNASKFYQNYEPDHFWIVLNRIESGLDINFINEGKMKSEAISYLLGDGPYPREASKEGKGGLEIVKESLDELSAVVADVYVDGDKTNIKIRFSNLS